VHVSTQAGVFNSFHRALLDGVDRVILPREMSLNQVRVFCERTGFPVEVFVQGALCFSMSGQCLMSSFLGGRSGNRGLCAQPCRKKFNGKYILSTRDLCLVERIPDIVSAGVSSLKIEGRLRSPEYIGAATALYRRAIDSLEAGHFGLDLDSFTDMELAFSRDYTEGMLMHVSDVVTPGAGGKRGVFLGVVGEGGRVLLETDLYVGDGVGVVSRGGMHGDRVKRIVCSGRDVGCAAGARWCVFLSMPMQGMSWFFPPESRAGNHMSSPAGSRYITGGSLWADLCMPLKRRVFGIRCSL